MTASLAQASKPSYDELVRWYARELRQQRSSREDHSIVRLKVKAMHEQIEASGIRVNSFLGNHLVDAYLSCASIKEAYEVFAGMPGRDVVVWTNMIRGYGDTGEFWKALDLFRQMQLEGVLPDELTFSTIICICSENKKLLATGKSIDDRIQELGLIQTNVVIATAVLRMYSASGCILKAQEVFEEIRRKDVVAWTSIINAVAENGDWLQAWKLYSRMQLEGMRPDEMTLMGLVNSCCSLSQGRVLHSHVAECWGNNNNLSEEESVFIDTAVVNMYARCGSLAEARDVFNKMDHPNVVTWTSIITANAQAGQVDQAMLLFREMQLQGQKPNGVTMATVISLCASTSNLREGARQHKHIIEAGISSDPVLQNSLLNMYAKCGAVDAASSIFHSIPTHHLTNFSWNSMLGAFAGQGNSEALHFLSQMLLQGIHIDTITAVGVLSACSRHSSLLKTGCSLFTSFVHGDFSGVECNVQLCSCLVDLLSRSGYLAEAEKFITELMPCPQDDVVWMGLLSACETYSDFDRGRRAAARIMELSPGYAGVYLHLSHMFAAQGSSDSADTSYEDEHGTSV